MAAVARGRGLPRAWLCRWGPDCPLGPERQPGAPRNPPLALCCRRAGPGCGRHYRAALCAQLKQPLAIEEVASRPVRPHEVRVDVHFCGVNFADILVCRGQYQEKPQLPFTPGMEFSGTVLETGTDVSTVKEGDQVIGVSGFNGMAEECIIDQKTLWQIPEGVPLREAATLPVSYGTAILALEHRACTRPGETVLVTAAAGATGLAVVDVATNVLRAQVIAAAGSDDKCKLAMQKGAQSTVNYGRGSLKEAVRKLVGSGRVNVAIDTVGGDVFLEALRSLAWEGRIVVVGFAGGTIASVPANLLLLKNVSAMGLYWGRYKEQNFPVFSRTLSSALQYCQQGLIQPHIGAVFKLEEVNDAFLHVIQRKSTGKVERDLDTEEDGHVKTGTENGVMQP
ncbi:quinone oxidoreductase-like protein 2 isoform X5 [Halichoerus grypus]|uniref:quinone oxidoreductase-like protein 2 isoform X6 n=1 Tax=Halichoerus grypus TaxID=9711 RepID=UPI0016591A60|nr:quinone oxidoreductase-like protein 2 isoform X6 [Halichoerus grypus]